MTELFFSLSDLEELARVTIPGSPGRKGNRRRLVYNRSTGKPSFIKSEEALAYVEEVKVATKHMGEMLLGKNKKDQILLVARVYFENWRKDLSIELLLDALQESGVLKDDRYVTAKIYFRLLDPENPRTELLLFKAPEKITIGLGGKEYEYPLVPE